MNGYADDEFSVIENDKNADKLAEDYDDAENDETDVNDNDGDNNAGGDI